jgi:hypothetical protein
MRLNSKIVLKPCGCVALPFNPVAFPIVQDLALAGASMEQIHVEIELAARADVPEPRRPVE